MAQTIFIADDDSATRDGLAMLLSDSGYRVMTFGDVPSALQTLDHAEPDLLITDVRMNGYNGLQLLALARKPLRAIVLTGFADKAIEADARGYGAEYLVKPVPFATLRAIIERMLAHPASAGNVRRAPRRQPRDPITVRVDNRIAHVIDVSATGARLELESDNTADLTHEFDVELLPSGTIVPVILAWKRRQDHAWICGVAVAPEGEGKWRAYFSVAVA